MKPDNDNGPKGAQVIKLPRPAPVDFSVNIPANVSSLVMIGLRPDGSLYFTTECDSLGDVSLILDRARQEVMLMAFPGPDDDGGDETPAA